MFKPFTRQNRIAGHRRRPLNPHNPEERQELIKQAVERTVKEYGEALKKLASD